MSKIVNMHEAKTHLSRLADEVHETGESFIIAKAGSPWVQVSLIPNKKPTFGSLAAEMQNVDIEAFEAMDQEFAEMFDSENDEHAA